MREVIKLIEPGDMLVRRYDNYLDGHFIPGYFSHAGLYVGAVTQDDEKLIKTEKGRANFKTGEQMVIHSMAEGVFMEDILNFCRCDGMAIVRFPKKFTATKKLSVKDIPFDQFNKKEKEYFNQLNNHKTLSYVNVFKTIFELALQQLGKKYDFDFNFKNYNDLSCTEFVYFCIKSLEGFHGLKPKERKIFMLNKSMIIPDAFMEVNFQKVWQSKSVKKTFA
jgi:hypothetical protein